MPSQMDFVNGDLAALVVAELFICAHWDSSNDDDVTSSGGSRAI
ncbi:hypothetical protein ACGFIV_34705 [Sphaerisporangium sp. NPDC049003]